MPGSRVHRPESGPNLESSHTSAATSDYEKILYPGAIEINVKGAFIVDDYEDTDSDGNSVSSLTPPETRDIALPHQTDEVSHIAVDIGGTLAKVVFFTRDPSGKGGRLNFVKFESEKIDECIAFMKKLIGLHASEQNRRRSISGTQSTPENDTRMTIMATGGGAHKFYDLMTEQLAVKVIAEDEMECLIIGLDFFITEIPEEVFVYSEDNPMQFVEARPNIYPYLLVNIGSGVSMIKVIGPKQYVRIGGSSLGGGTLWGLLSLLTDAASYDEMLEMAGRGDNANVDMLVGDIYGTDYSRIGLKATTIASSFGKVFKKAVGNPAALEHHEHREPTVELNGQLSKAERLAKFRDEDISRSLLYAISNNIGQIAYLQAQKHSLEHIYFGGSYIRGHPETMNTLSYAIRFWSEGVKKAYFLRHEGFLGAVGAFIRRQPEGWGRRNSGGGKEELDFRGFRD